MGTCGTEPVVFIAMFGWKLLLCCCRCCFELFVCEQIRKTQAEPQWIVAQRLLSALTIPEVFKSSAKELSFQQRLYN